LKEKIQGQKNSFEMENVGKNWENWKKILKDKIIKRLPIFDKNLKNWEKIEKLAAELELGKSSIG
jgi:hypothetical protein